MKLWHRTAQKHMEINPYQKATKNLAYIEYESAAKKKISTIFE